MALNHLPIFYRRRFWHNVICKTVSGYSGGGGGPPASNDILREDGFYMLREDGSKFIRET